MARGKRRPRGDDPASRELADLQRRIMARPDDPELLTAAALTWLKLGNAGEAEDLLRTALAYVPAHAPAQFQLGNLLKGLGRLDEALKAYDGALRLSPNDADALTNKGAVLHELGDADGAQTAYEAALEAVPGHADARYNLAIVQQEAGDLEAALDAYEDVLRHDPKHTGAKVNKAYALKELGRVEAALKTAEEAARDAPEYDKLHANLGDLYLETGQVARAIHLADAFLTRAPGNPTMLAFKGVALQEAEEAHALSRLLDFDRYVRPIRVKPPQDFQGLADFNAALARHVREHPSLVHAPASHATRFGKHSGELLVEPKGPIAGLEKAILSAAKAYWQEFEFDRDVPFQPKNPAKCSLAVWGVVMEDKGHQLAHIHPAAWLSGVYYPEIPDLVRDDDPDHQGWIEFGRPPDDFHQTKGPLTKLYKPEEGLMILFPSYMYHGTVPFHAPVERMSIAFDVVPGG